MSFETFGRKRRFGRTQQLQMVPSAKTLTFSDFSGGLDYRDSRQDVPANTTPSALDVETAPLDRIHRIHGVTTSEQWTEDTNPGLEPRQLVLHTSLEYSTELLIFAPPKIGVKKEGTTTWYDVGLPEGPLYGWVNHGGTLVFSNRLENKVFVRQPESTTIAELTGGIAGLTYASFAGRIFVGNAIIDGNTERLGLAWSGVSGNWDDWDGDGWGFELLIDDMSVGDKIVALKTMGLNLMAIMCRNSIWLAQRTGLLDRPAAPLPRVPKIGALNAAVCQTTRQGVMFLHDSGVHLFDGNSVQHLSAAIDAELLPLDYTQVDKYSSVYSPKTRRYYLFTPTVTWQYDVQRARWWKMSLNALDAVLWSEQFNALTWDELVGTWDEQTLNWDEFTPEQTEDYKLWFLGASATGTALGYEKEGLNCYFGLMQTPYYQLPLVQDQPMDRLLTTQNVILEYEGYGRLGLRQPDHLGDFVGTAVYDLLSTAAAKVVQLPYVHTGLGNGLQLDLGTGCVEISKVELQTLPRGPRILDAPLVRADVEGYDSLSTLPEVFDPEL